MRDAGSFWLRTVDNVDNMEDNKVRLEFSKQAGEYCLWLMPYSTIFTYQYLIQDKNLKLDYIQNVEIKSLKTEEKIYYFTQNKG